jgi:bis(5'-nucleosyl)-tetraphosphatase (symmetrical)
MRLLRRLNFSPQQDHLWLCGDLVNRGGQSLEVLRWARQLGDRVVMVLGNHDLKLLAVAHGCAQLGGRDSLRQVLDAPDAPELLSWLLQQPLLHVGTDRLEKFWMVHAGLCPSWSLPQAKAAAAAAQAALRAEPRHFLQAYGERLAPIRPFCQPEASGHPLYAAHVLTTMRICRLSGDILSSFSDPPERAPGGFAPWFVWPTPRPASPTLIVGHWSALGLYRGHQIVALDSGCVWGRSLSALNLQTDELISEPAGDFT